MKTHPFRLAFQGAFLAAALLLSLPVARATVLLELAGGYLKDEAGNAITPGSGLLVLVASTGDSDFSSLTDASQFVVGGLLNEATDDYVLYTSSVSGDGAMDGVATSGEFRQVISLSLTTTISAGVSLGLYWIPDVSLSAASAEAGTAYGFYRSLVSVGSTDADGSEAWVLPTDGTSGWSLLFLTSDANSAVNTSASGTSLGTAIYSVVAVPEPATWSCVMAGLAAILALGRRKA